MTTEKEQEAFGLVIEHHKNATSENDIRYAFQRFMEMAAIAAASEMSTQGPPGTGNPGRMDLYIHNTCIEFKKFIVRDGVPIPGYVTQLDADGQLGYLDILILNRDYHTLIAIENKTFSQEHSNQLTRYRHALANAYPGFARHHIFLSPAAQPPNLERDRKYWQPARFHWPTTIWTA